MWTDLRNPRRVDTHVETVISNGVYATDAHLGDDMAVSTHHGSLSKTRRAKAVARQYTDAGVPRGKIGVVDSRHDPECQYGFEKGAGPQYVTVWEKPADTSDDLTTDEFAAFMRVSNRLVNGHRRNYYANEDDTRCVIRHAFIDEQLMTDDDSPAEAGKDLADPSDEQSDENTSERFYVHHNGGNRFTVHDDESQKTYRVDLDKVGSADIVECIDGGGDGGNSVPETDRGYILGAIVQAGPEYRPGPQETLNITLEGAAGNASGTSQSGGSSGTDSSPSDVEVVTAPGSDHDHDPDELTENVDEWLTNYANVKGDLVEGWWDLSLQTLTNPSNGSSNLGVHIELEPFGHSCWDGDSWSTDDSKDEWTDHQKAMRSIFSDDDSPVQAFSVETDDEYDDWYNYVPAEDAEDLP